MRFKIALIFSVLFFILVSTLIYKVYHVIPESDSFDKYGVKSKSFYSSGKESRNEALALQFFELNKGKTNDRIFGFNYNDKDYRGFFVDPEGQVYIGISKSWLANQSMINSIWWKYVDGNDSGMLYYRTEPDNKVEGLSKEIKQEIDDLSFLPISSDEVSNIKVWGYGIDGREATTEEKLNLLKSLNGVKNFEKETNLPSERKKPISEIEIYLKSKQEISIHGYGKNLELNWSYQFEQPELQQFLDALGKTK
jgi:hypothetical protein